MQQKYTLLLSLFLATGFFAHADNHTSYPRMNLETAVQEADETRMAIEGIFLRQNGSEEDEFIFKDTDGKEIIVYDAGEGKTVRFDAPVIINGEIDRGLFRAEFNLHSTSYLEDVVALKQEKDIAPVDAPPTSEQVGVQDGIFIHLSSGSDHPRRVAMALTMASTFADDNPVLLYADLDAVILFTKKGGDVSPEGYRALSEQLPDLIEAGVQIHVCPTCLAAAGLSSVDLRDGVQLADKRGFLSFAEGRILTFDY